MGTKTVLLAAGFLCFSIFTLFWFVMNNEPEASVLSAVAIFMCGLLMIIELLKQIAESEKA